MVASMFVVVTSLVLGLMINAAKNSFQEIDDHVHAYATQLILVDRSLRKLGPEAINARQPLVGYVQRDDRPRLRRRTVHRRRPHVRSADRRHQRRPQRS